MTGFRPSTIVRHCRQYGIEVMLIKVIKFKWQQAFVRIEDQPTLLSFLSELDFSRRRQRTEQACNMKRKQD